MKFVLLIIIALSLAVPNNAAATDSPAYTYYYFDNSPYACRFNPDLGRSDFGRVSPDHRHWKKISKASERSSIVSSISRLKVRLRMLRLRGGQPSKRAIKKVVAQLSALKFRKASIQPNYRFCRDYNPGVCMTCQESDCPSYCSINPEPPIEGDQPQSPENPPLTPTPIPSPTPTPIVADWYVSANGIGSACSESFPCTLDEVKAKVSPGDLVFLEPGDYGDVSFKEQLGSDENYVTFMANPYTNTPRPSSWYTVPVPPADPSNKVVFRSLTLEQLRDTTSGEAIRKNIAIQDINIVPGMVFGQYFVAGVTLRRVNIYGAWGDFSSQVPTGIYLKDSFGVGGNFHHFIVEECYIQDTNPAMIILGTTSGGVEILNNHIYHTAGTGISLWAQNPPDQPVIIRGNLIHNQEQLPDTIKHYRSIASIDPQAPLQVLHLDQADLTYYDAISLINPDTSLPEVRLISSYDAATATVTTLQPFTFTPQLGAQAVIWDSNHGSGLALRASNVVIEENTIYATGATRVIYAYQTNLENIKLRRNLIYSPKNGVASVDFYYGLGGGAEIVGNTIIGEQGRTYGEWRPEYYYGLALAVALAAGVPPDSINISNNILIGTADLPAGVVASGNIAFHAPTLNNASNLVIYQGQSFPNEPHTFSGSGNFFVGGAGFDAWNFAGNVDQNFIEALHPLNSSPACDGSVSSAPIGALSCVAD